MQDAERSLRAWPDGRLERLAAQGNREAFAELYERHSQRVYDFLMRLVRDTEDAADLMQETFVRAMRSLSAERAGQAAFSTWLFAIGSNLTLARLERKKRTTPLVTQTSDDEPVEYERVAPSWSDDPSEQ